MNPEIKAQWVAALRSGETAASGADAASANGSAVVYQQGAGQLHNPVTNEFCCLGVLCDLAVRAGVIVATERDGESYTLYDGRGAALPASVMTWAGLDSSDPELAPSKDNDEELYFWDEASELNDSGVPFSQIADLIEWGL